MVADDEYIEFRTVIVIEYLSKGSNDATSHWVVVMLIQESVNWFTPSCRLDTWIILNNDNNVKYASF